MDKKKLSQLLWGLWIVIWIIIAFLLKLDNLIVIILMLVILWVGLSKIPFILGKKETEANTTKVEDKKNDSKITE